jgi:hypothetical protein
MRKLAGTLTTKVGVAVEATYQDYGSNRGWSLSWTDGPTVATMRKRAAAAARGVTVIDVKALRYQRNKTDLASVAAFLGHVLANPALLENPPIEVLYAHEDTDFPGSITAEAWELARFAFAQTGTGEYEYMADRTVIDHIVRNGLNGLRLDMALTSEGRQTECQPRLPALELAGVGDKLEAAVARALDEAVRDLLAGSAHRDDPRLQLQAVESLRGLLLKPADRAQRRIAAPALVDGVGLSWLSTAIGRSPRTLGMRFGKDLEADLAPLAWLRDNAAAWASACVAAAAAVRAATRFFPARFELATLEACDAAHGWRSLIGTPDAARHVLAEIRRTQLAGEAAEPLRHLAQLLDAHDHADPPGQRERRLRRPPVTPETPGTT